MRAPFSVLYAVVTAAILAHPSVACLPSIEAAVGVEAVARTPAASAWGAEGETFRVTNDGNAGPGSFGEAVSRASASAGAGTITFDASLDVTLSESWILEEDATVRGNGAAVHWEPGEPGQGPLLSGEGVALQMVGLTMVAGAAAAEPLVHLTAAPPGHGTVFEQVTVTHPRGGAIVLEQEEGNIDFAAFTARGEKSDDACGYNPAVQIRESTGSITISDSEFSHLACGGIQLMNGQLDAGDALTIRGTRFSDIFVNERDAVGWR